MNLQTLTSLLLATATLAWAVPSEIIYQSRLTDANGDAVTGDVTMSLKMFDAATEGNEIYSEDIGTVTLDSNGIYSFEFGAGGQSVVSTSESIATTDGTNSIYNATLENLPVDGSISVSDGTNTWSQANGSSSSTEFTASVTPSSGAVSAIYLGSTPASGVDITASYNYMDTTLSGALSSHASHWLELSVDGTVQSPRERVLSVPFAQIARASLSEESRFFKVIYYNDWVVRNSPRDGINLSHHNCIPLTHNSSGSWVQDDVVEITRSIEPNRARYLASMEAEMFEFPGNQNPSVKVHLRRYSSEEGHEFIAELDTNIDDSTVPKPYITKFSPRISIDFSKYTYDIVCFIRTNDSGQYNSGGGGLNLVRLTYSR